MNLNELVVSYGDVVTNVFAEVYYERYVEKLYPESPESIPTYLERAADLIEYRGWGQGHYVSADGGLCTLGAIRAAVHGVDFRGKVTENPVVDALRAYLGFYCIATWNDQPWRSRADVLDALRGAATEYREQGYVVPRKMVDTLVEKTFASPKLLTPLIEVFKLEAIAAQAIQRAQRSAKEVTGETNYAADAGGGKAAGRDRDADDARNADQRTRTEPLRHGRGAAIFGPLRGGGVPASRCRDLATEALAELA